MKLIRNVNGDVEKLIQTTNNYKSFSEYVVNEKCLDCGAQRKEWISGFWGEDCWKCEAETVIVAEDGREVCAEDYDAPDISSMTVNEFSSLCRYFMGKEWDGFIQFLKKPLDYNNALSKLSQEYGRNVGISLGLRTFFWDAMFDLCFQLKGANDDCSYDEIQQIVELENPEYKPGQSDDVGRLNVDEHFYIGYREYLLSDSALQHCLAYAIYCGTLKAGSGFRGGD